MASRKSSIVVIQDMCGKSMWTTQSQHDHSRDLPAPLLRACVVSEDVDRAVEDARHRGLCS